MIYQRLTKLTIGQIFFIENSKIGNEIIDIYEDRVFYKPVGQYKYYFKYIKNWVLIIE